jgi:hypothetical protein
MLKGADGGFALHGGKILKELVQSLSPLDVIQQGLERNSSPAEHRGPAKNIGIFHNDAVGRRHSRISPSVYPSELRNTNPTIWARADGFRYPHAVIPTGVDHRGGDDLRSGEPALSAVEGDLAFSVRTDADDSRRAIGTRSE